MMFEGRKVVQRSGVCIGSRVTSVVSGIFLSAIDRDIESSLEKGLFKRIVRYVYDYLLIFNKNGERGDGIILDAAAQLFYNKSSSLVLRQSHR